MPQSRDHLHFAAEPLPVVGSVQLVMEHLDGERALEPRVEGLEDGRESAPAENPADFDGRG